MGNLEFPTERDLMNNSNPDVWGWALSKFGDQLEVKILVDQKVVGTTSTGLPRIDVENSYPDIKNSYESGFYTTINLRNFKDGKHVMTVVVKNNNSTKVVAKTNFQLENKKPDVKDPVYTSKAFTESGQRFCNQYLVKLGGLKPSDRVLDVGCAIGRIAMPLIKFLNKNGSYEGIDIVPPAIKWCTKNISPKFPNFRFTLADVYNKRYNINAKTTADEYKFPYEDNSFDFVFLASIFTHLIPKDMENYFREISRVLKKGGKCLITFFLLNEESVKLIKEGKSIQPFVYELDGFWTTMKNLPEAAIAYDEKYIKKLYEKNELSILEPIFYGSWSGRKNFTAPQDIIIAKKNNFS